MAMDLMYKVRVIGDHKSGKTEMLLAMAEKLCRHGHKVLYIAESWPQARECFYRMDRDLYGQSGFKSYRTHGSERVTHESGGSVCFMANTKNAGRGLVADTILLDDVRADFDYPLPVRIVRASS